MLGLETTVTVGRQSSAELPESLPRYSLQVYSITGGQGENDTDDNVLGGGLENVSDSVSPGPGLDDHKITVKVPLCSVQFAFWCCIYFGDAVDSGDDPDYSHVWVSGQDLPYIYLEHRLRSGLLRRHIGLVGESITIDLDAEREGYGQAEFTFVGLREETATDVLDGLIEPAPDLQRTAQKRVLALYDGASRPELMGGKLTFTRVLKRLRSGDGTGLPYAVEIDGISSLTGSLRVRYLDDSFHDDAVAKTVRSLGLHLLRTPTRGVKFDVPTQRLSRTPIGVDGPGGIEQQWDFRGWQTADDPALTVTCLNDVAQAGFPVDGALDFRVPGNPLFVVL